ncbi:MAG: protein kinase [Acidobacteriia bacterium]|nr:protein kinase [Terriglobia bacterium]
MTLSAGTKLGSYEITGAIGAGGMGEVYRARDAKLGRDVALKSLPERFARDTERMSRFQREAKVLASLNHPNIASIYGLEDSGQTHALVMELVEGPTLADRVKQGPIPIGEALRIAKQICEALEYAHEHGIVHRDLKPANVKVTNDDAVKVLDFGLAKAFEGDASSIDIANSPTISRMATQAGVLLGTAAYMSPEQAKGKAVDRRADIWGFGCVLYEMLTGKMAFQGETVTDTLAAVIRAEPDWSQLPAATPIRVRVLLQRCLQKDTKQRLQAIGDARISLEEVLSGAQDPTAAAPTGRPAKRWLLWVACGAAGVFVLGTALFAFLYFHQERHAGQVMRFEIPVPENMKLTGVFSLSPDGRKLVFIASGTDGLARLWVRSIEALDAQPLAGTEGVSGPPFWSPDSRFVAFPSQGVLKKVDITGGPSVTICNAPAFFGGTWSRDDEIVFGSIIGTRKVAASGGTPLPVTQGGADIGPNFLPDGHHFVYWRSLTQDPKGPGIYVNSVDSKPEDGPGKRLLSDISEVAYAPSPGSSTGHLLFVRGGSDAGSFGTLMAQPFDPVRLEFIGEAVPLAEKVSNLSFSASATDVLVYLTSFVPVATGGARGNVYGQLSWFDRTGNIVTAFGDVGVYRSLAMSPDGQRVAFERVDLQNAGNRNIWLYEFARGVTTRFTFDLSWNSNPIWSPDGDRIMFLSNRTGVFDLYQKTSNLAGEDQVLFKSNEFKNPSSWSPDGRFVLYYNPVPPAHVWLLPLGGVADHKPIALEHSAFSQAAGRFSPDGRWIAYSSDESGKDQIYVRPFDASSLTENSPTTGLPVGGKWMVSKEGGTTPLWRRDGKELFYLSLDGQAMAVDVSTAGVFQAGIPKTLFKVPRGVLFWDVSTDGKRFLMPSPSAASAQPPFTVVLNWETGLKK